MLPRLTIGFIVLSAAIVIAACSSYGAGSTVNVGPNFPSMTLYATNSNQNAISIYNKGQKSGSGPTFEIGGASTTLNGPQYLAFDTRQQSVGHQLQPVDEPRAADRDRSAGDRRRDSVAIGRHSTDACAASRFQP